MSVVSDLTSKFLAQDFGLEVDMVFDLDPEEDRLVVRADAETTVRQRISSFDQKPLNGMMPQMASHPAINVR